MAILEWDKRLETGIEEIDRQHRELFNRIDALDLSIYENKSRVELVKMFEYLESYVEKHFEAEEGLMLRAAYPGFDKHHLEHDNFRRQYARMKKEYQARGADTYMALNIDKEIRKWWENHIMTVDMGYVPYLKNML